MLRLVVRSQRADAKHFEPLHPQLVDPARLPQPYPPVHLLGTTIAAVAVTAAGALFSRWLVRAWYHPLGGLIHGSFMLLVVGGLVYALLRHESDRRTATIERLRIVAECNHHIRNALQVLILTGDAPTEQVTLGVQQVADAVHRIDLTLSEVLPRVLDEVHPDAERAIRLHRKLC
jgi:hypothetical protein